MPANEVSNHGAKAIREKYRYYTNEIKMHVGCEECHIFPANVDEVKHFHFDHINAETKIARISVMISETVSWSKIQAEIEKCQVLCVNCHKKKHGNIPHFRHFNFGVRYD